MKNKQQDYEKLVEMSINDIYRTINLLDYPYHENYYKLTRTDLSRHSNITIPQQIHFTGKLEDNGATMFSMTEK